MIKPYGSDELNPLFVYDSEEHHKLAQEAEGLPSLLVNSAAAANAVMLPPAKLTAKRSGIMPRANWLLKPPVAPSPM